VTFVVIRDVFKARRPHQRSRSFCVVLPDVYVPYEVGVLFLSKSVVVVVPTSLNNNIIYSPIKVCLIPVCPVCHLPQEKV
jgi:hypothetical protein